MEEEEVDDEQMYKGEMKQMKEEDVQTLLLELRQLTGSRLPAWLESSRDAAPSAHAVHVMAGPSGGMCWGKGGGDGGPWSHRVVAANDVASSTMAVARVST